MEQDLLQEYKDMQVTLNGLKLEIETLPKGYIRSREIAGKYYYYLQYREGDTVRSDYLNEEERNTVSEKINKRKDLQCQKAELEKSLRILEQNLGIHHYRPVKNIDYSEYTLFISYIAHEYKRLGKMSFLASFDIKKYRGVKKKYLKGFG